MREALAISYRRACRVLGQVRRTQRYTPIVAYHEAVLTANVVSLACEYGRYGYRRITALLQSDGWRVNHKRVERIWRLEGLKVPARQPKRGRLWLNDGSCIRLRPEPRNHVWAYDFVFDRTREGRPLKLFTVVDEYTGRVPDDRGCPQTDITGRAQNAGEADAEVWCSGTHPVGQRAGVRGQSRPVLALEARSRNALH